MWVIYQLSCNFCKSLVVSAVQSYKMPYYAVARGRSIGIFMTWGECEAQVKGFSGARYKKFDSVASAEQFINTEGKAGTAPKSKQTYQPNYPGTSNHNLKRTYSTSSSNQTATNSTATKKNTKPPVKHNSKARPSYSDDSYSDSDSNSDSFLDDSLNTVIHKQLDVIEERVNKFSNRLDKIYKTSTKKSEKRSILIEPPQPKKRRSTNGFEEDGDGYIQVYTDGACSSNGRKGARAGLGVYWGDEHPLNTSEPVSGRATNNCGEIQAATHAIKQALQNGVTKLAINTDSQFLINSVTKWMPGWKRKGWKLQSGEPVKNEKDFKELDSLQHKLQIKWNYVEAHRGIHGNEKADQLAKAGASMYNN